jgi:ligand-binding SRPBCC domain-containing protein
MSTGRRGAPPRVFFSSGHLYNRLVASFTITTIIRAPPERCFDLARSIDFHAWSMRHTGERPVGGCTTGLIKQGQTVTWRARHLFVTQHLTSVITDFDRPHTFADEQVAGAFHSFRHVHRFTEQDRGVTLVEDIFTFKAPLGLLGRIAELLFLTRYMTRLLQRHHQHLKHAAESEEWKRFLPSSHDDRAA